MYGGVKGSLFRGFSLVTLWENICWYLFRGIMLTCTPALILMVMLLVLFFVVSNNLVQRATCLSDACSARREPSLGLLDVSMLLVGDGAGTVSILSL